MNRRPRNFILLAFLMLLLGAVIPFLIIIGLLQSTLLINFLTYILSTAGLFLGIIGIAMFVGKERSKRQDDWQEW